METNPVNGRAQAYFSSSEKQSLIYQLNISYTIGLAFNKVFEDVIDVYAQGNSSE